RAAHTLGLAHGRLGPDTVRLGPARALVLDFTGADTGAGEAGAPSLPGDVHALGGLLAWMLSGRPAGDQTSPALGPALRALLDGRRAPQPSDRLSIQEVEERLALLRKGSSDLAATNALSPGSWPSGGTPPLLSDGSQEGRGRSLLARHLGAAPAADLLA